ncbi:hypothetical protein OKW47_002289 [Paraburkholderia atlantica]
MEKPDRAGPGECPSADYSNSAGRSPTYGTTWFYSQWYLVLRTRLFLRQIEKRAYALLRKPFCLR